MSPDAGRPSRAQPGLIDRQGGVDGCARLGARLSRTPLAERDLRWHLLAYHVGELGALASARLRASAPTTDR